MEIRIKRIFLSAGLCIHLQDITLHKLWLDLSLGKFTNHMYNVDFKRSSLFSHVTLVVSTDMDSSNISSTSGSICRCKILLSHPDFGKLWHCNMDSKDFHSKWFRALLKKQNFCLWTAVMCCILRIVTVVVPVCSSSAICVRGSRGTAAPELWPTAWRPPSPAWLFFTSHSLSPKHTAGLQSPHLYDSSFLNVDHFTDSLFFQ